MLITFWHKGNTVKPGYNELSNNKCIGQVPSCSFYLSVTVTGGPRYSQS